MAVTREISGATDGAPRVFTEPEGVEQVPRPRISRMLEQGAPVTVMVAPAGFGKTTALGVWRQESSRSVAWLTVSVDDSDAAAFVGRLLDAIETVLPGLGTATRQMLHMGTGSARSLGRALRDDVAASTPVTVVIDDFHEIQSSEASAVVSELLRSLPDTLRLVVSSRWDPNLPLARLRTQGQLMDIRAADLRFTPAEARALLAAALGSDPSDEVVNALSEKTDGWAAVLRLAGVALAGSPPAGSDQELLPISDERHLIDYLMDEVLARQPEGVRHVLVRTSILDRVCGSLADAMVDPPPSAETSEAALAWLAAAGILEARRDDGRVWYHPHELFRDLLRTRLRMEMQMAEVIALNRRACAWMVARDMVAEAIDQALWVEDYGHAADLVERFRMDYLRREDWQTLDEWIGKLPNAIVRERVPLLVTRMRTGFFRGVLPDGQRGVADVRARIEAMANDTENTGVRELAAEVDLVDMHRRFMVAEDVDQIATIADEVIQHLHPDDSSGRGIAIMTWAYALDGMDRSDEALSRLGELLASQTDDGGAYYARILFAQCVIDLRRGRLLRLEHVFRNLIRLTDEHGLELLNAWGHCGLGQVAYERNDLAEAEAQFMSALPARPNVHIWAAQWSLAGLAMVANARHDTALTEEWLARLDQFILDRGPLSGLELVDAFRARIDQINGETSAINRIGLDASARVWEHPHYFEFPSVVRARVLLMRGEPDDLDMALRLVIDLEKWAEAYREDRRLVEVLLVRALVEHAVGDYDRAIDAMVRSLELIGDEPFVRTFLDLGFDILPILRLVRTSDRCPRNIERIERLVRGKAAPETRTRETVRVHRISEVHVYEVLTEREVDVLRGIGEHLTNQEIGDRLYISPLTVKRHASNIYEKLGVNNRRQAIVKATDLGYL